VLAAGDRVVVVARRAGLRALLEQATPPAATQPVDNPA
jgi:hypothetical protein